jgi:2-deoxy-D-gluconate 3-dehydrogenase
MSLPNGLAEFSLAGRHIVVTGAGRGIGAAIAHSVAAAGGTVTLVARDAAQLRETATVIESGGGVAHSLAADLTDLDGIDDLIGGIESTHGPIDGIVHAAGTQLRRPAEELTAADLRTVLSLNLESPMLASSSVARRQLAEKRGGSHIFIGSLNSTIGLPRVSPYAASKTGIVGAMRSMSAEWSSRGIRVNVVAPGYFLTSMTQGLLDNPEDHRRILSRIPMGRLGEAAEVGPVVVFALSDAARYVTGQVLNVDGGWLGS